MAVGVRVYQDAAGAVGPILVDTTDLLLTILGQLSASAPFSVTDARFANGTFWYFYMPSGDPVSRENVPQVSFSSNTMSVTAGDFDGIFTYGFR